MNRIAVSIKNRLSLRPPQAESLDILAELAGQLFWFPRSAWEPIPDALASWIQPRSLPQDVPTRSMGTRKYMHGNEKVCAWERESMCMGTKNRIEKWIRQCRIDLSCSHAPRGSTFPDAQRQELWM